MPSPKSIVREIMPPLGSVLAEESAVIQQSESVPALWCDRSPGRLAETHSWSIQKNLSYPKGRGKSTTQSTQARSQFSSARTLKVLSWE